MVKYLKPHPGQIHIWDGQTMQTMQCYITFEREKTVWGLEESFVQRFLALVVCDAV